MFYILFGAPKAQKGLQIYENYGEKQNYFTLLTSPLRLSIFVLHKLSAASLIDRRKAPCVKMPAGWSTPTRRHLLFYRYFT